MAARAQAAVPSWRVSGPQRNAADPTRSVWVAASAGAGKTKVLTDRVMRLLLDGAPPARLLCLTFTRAAAAEMANRINRDLGHWTLVDDALTLGKQVLGRIASRKAAAVGKGTGT